MKKVVLMLFVVTTFLPLGNAQLWKLRRLEVGGGPGTTQFYGDIGGYSKGKNVIGLKDFTYLHTRWNINANARYRINENVSARLNFNFGKFRSTDARGSNEARGLESSTLFFEPSVMGEYYYLKNKGENSYLSLRGKKPFLTLISMMDCYVFAGVGGISYTVKPNDKLATFPIPKSGFAPVIPMGLGVSVVYRRDVMLGMELGGRFPFTDNLEGYTSVYSKANDVYYFFNFTATYKIKLGGGGTPSL
jgi:hypothetical protein